MADSAVLMCMNLACFAVFSNKRHFLDQKYAQVFGYTADMEFLKKARIFIGHVVYEYAVKMNHIAAKTLV